MQRHVTFQMDHLAIATQAERRVNRVGPEDLSTVELPCAHALQLCRQRKTGRHNGPDCNAGPHL